MSGKFHMQNSKAAKVNAAIVRQIRELYSSGWTQSRLCREFDLSVGQIGKIVRMESWKHLPPPPASAEEIAASGLRMLAVQEEVNRANQTAAERLAADIAKQREEGKAADKALDELTADAEGSGSEF